PVESAKELGHLALVICDTELIRATKLRKEEDEHLARLAGTYQGELGPGAGVGIRGPGGEGGPGGLRPIRPLQGMGGPGGEGRMPIDPSMMDPKQYRYDYARRRLRQQLYCVQLG